MTFEKEIDGKKIIFTIDNLAEQANASVFAQLGDTVVLATVTMSNQEIQDRDFFPLTVEFLERYYAAGKILGSRFVRREGKPTEEAILTARLIDRPIRPLFEDDYNYETQVIATVISMDKINEPDFDVDDLSQEEKIELVDESDGLLIDILEGETIMGDLDLRGCTSLTHLPDNLKVLGDMSLDDCTSLTHLPNNLKIDGCLDISGCVSLTHLPDGLQIGENLYLENCTSLTEIPKTVKIGGKIHGLEHLR